MSLDSKCVGCTPNSSFKYICDDCMNNPFITENLRGHFAKLNDLTNLEKLYSNTAAYFSEGVPAKLWTNKFENIGDPNEDWNKHRTYRALDLVTNENVQSFLDIGVGMGYAIKKLHSRFPKAKVHGVDFSSSVLEKMAKEISGEYSSSSIEEISFNRKFHVITLFEVLEHIEVPRNQNTLKKIYNMLEDDGEFIISVPLDDDLKMAMFKCPHCDKFINRLGHVRSYTPELVKAELRMAGFKVADEALIVGGKYRGISRQWLMKYFPKKIHPMVIALRCEK